MAILNKSSQAKKVEHHLSVDQPKSMAASAEQRDFTTPDQKEASPANTEQASTEHAVNRENQPFQAGQSAASTASQNASSLASQKIERILEENLADLYFSLDEGHRRIFKEEGEKTAQQIEMVIKRGKSVLVKIIELIKHWFKLIPGVNKFFIEQEAKIKAEKILQDLQPPLSKL